MAAPSYLCPSSRTRFRSARAGLPYISGVIEGFMDPYDAKTNPNGVILMAVAENKLTWDLLKPKIEQGFENLPQVCALPQHART